MRERGKRVTQILPGFARHRFRRSGRIQRRLAWSLEVLMGLALWVFASLASAQATPGPSRIQERKEKPANPVVVAPAQQTPHPVVPIYGAAAPEQTLPQPPEIDWDGKLLTIDAENSKLSDVLLAVRAKTGASIDFPGGATSERVAVHLGPAPVREVLSSLLYGTNFDYVIQGAGGDEEGLRSVVVTTRGGGIDDAAVVADTQEHPGMRLMPGYAAPGKRAFQAAAEAAAAQSDQSTPENSAAAAEAAFAAGDVSSPTSEPGSAPAGAESASSQPASTDTQSPSPTADAGLGLSDGSSSPRATISSTASTASSSPGSGPLPQMIQDMTRLFQQRQQIQAQQNQASKPPTN
jgi:hypothetical protein